MDEVFVALTRELAGWLGRQLPALGGNWWADAVISKLSFQQQRSVEDRGCKALEQLDLAALLRILDLNWFELKDAVPGERDVRTWVKELQSVRNRWAHRSAERMPASEVYRDVDTVGRVLAVLNADSPALELVERVRAEALLDLTPSALVEQPVPSQGPMSLFSAGELVALRARPDVRVPILRVVQGAHERRYEVFQDNAVVSYYESQLQAIGPARAAYNLLSVAELRGHLTSLKLLSPSVASLLSLGTGRVDFVPYQYRPVLKMIRADRPRLLVADEVGVGKTIEAALVLKELQARMDIRSVLVICPKPLVAERKWFTELKRFDEQFVALDSPTLRNCLQETHLEGEWPQSHSRAILPFSLFDAEMVHGGTSRRGVARQGLLTLDPPPKFDLVIVDEAHHLRNPDTYLHQGVRFLCDHAQAVLLLTATPVQLGSDDLFTLLNVLRPDLIIDRPSFQQMAEPNRHINAAVLSLRTAAQDWQSDGLKALEEAAMTEWGRLFLRESPDFQSVYDRLGGDPLAHSDRVSLIADLEALYTFSSLINRTRRRDIGDFTTRKPETMEVPFTEQQATFHDTLLDVVSRILTGMHGDQNVDFMMSTIRRQAASSLYGLAPLLRDMLSGKMGQLDAMTGGLDDVSEIHFVEAIRADVSTLLQQADMLDPHDPKVDAFLDILVQKSQQPNDKALVFSTFRHTLRYLQAHVEAAGIRLGMIHGDVPDEERREIRRRFALERHHDDAIDVLLSSEVGCEGLDFQFCDMIINYDLPWNPMRIEQRIGRIDRYGQASDTVTIVNLITPGTVDSEIYHRCLFRIGVFNQAVGGNEEILGEITREIRQIADSTKLTPEERNRRLQQLADNSIRQVQEEQALEAGQAELFGLSVPKQAWREELKAAQSFWLSAASLQNAVNSYLASRLEREKDTLTGDRAVKNLRLSQEARDLLLDDFLKLPRTQDPVSRTWEKWLKGNAPNLQVTFEQEAAKDQPGVMHLTATHPLIRQAARHLELREPRDVSLQAVGHDLPAGTYPFAVYRWVKYGVRGDEDLVAVAMDGRVESAVMDVLQHGEMGTAPPMDEAGKEHLEARHHELWAEAQAAHCAHNRQLVDFRLQSLTVSHRARMQSIQDQLHRATNNKIRLMKESELGRADADFQRRSAELEQAARSGDVLAAPVLFGTIEITPGGQQ
ncbi:DEAD/DEAH box helicase [Deinococcus sp. AJ005]|uniref:DEAD/DEAH box helicase n=1 Tax=Deinococcus sp. AJ005 TaxID=2652443 RepID=UPI00125CB6B9|nr:helicase-related protein [Deinococcus sp. AJ005]QFP75445.1 DEAD/DEAH box helicase [Deinococcus sp. AJ005]